LRRHPNQGTVASVRSPLDHLSEQSWPSYQWPVRYNLGFLSSVTTKSPLKQFFCTKETEVVVKVWGVPHSNIKLGDKHKKLSTNSSFHICFSVIVMVRNPHCWHIHIADIMIAPDRLILYQGSLDIQGDQKAPNSQ